MGGTDGRDGTEGTDGTAGRTEPPWEMLRKVTGAELGGRVGLDTKAEGIGPSSERYRD